jgi:hypothetical protein
MTPARYFFALLLIAAPLSAQQLSHPLMATRADARMTARPFSPQVDVVKILAIMVQFQPDNTTLTSGDGRFDLSDGTDPVIDAPPRNRQYFRDHLTFVENYFRRTSKGRATIETTILDSVFTLSRQMQDYAPPKTGSTIAVGNLAVEAWHMVDSLNPSIDFSSYNCFVIFHAGVGRDIDLVSLLGYDPTPYDIPSLFVGLNGFRQYFGSGYQGIPVDHDSSHITNTIVIPETESRVLPTTTGSTLLELGINGLLCASVGNFLGLPDLFDTNTGRSGIGRFGLMDGQSIFSFKGVFPPEPSAWEKYWLGWTNPIVLEATGAAQSIRLPAVGLQTARDGLVADTVYRIPISGQEYFLVENRSRDPHDRPQEAGQKVWSTFRGVARTQTFPADDPGFNAFGIDSLAGVITNVEDYDWSLPGGVSSAEPFYDGGTLIWHIDEAVIAQGLQTNGVNADPKRRGVDLEEADGSQDIGQQYEFLSPGSGSEEGTALDFWYSGNAAPVNRNVFSSTTHPDSRSNEGANSHIAISDFTTFGSHMTARVQVGDGVVAPLPGFPKLAGQQLTRPSLVVGNLGSQNVAGLLIASTLASSNRPSRQPAPDALSASLYAWGVNGSSILPHQEFANTGEIATLAPPYAGVPAIMPLDTVNDVVAITNQAASGSILVYRSLPRSGDSTAVLRLQVPVSRRLTTSPLVTDSMIVTGGTGGVAYILRKIGGALDSVSVAGDTSDVTGVCAYPSTDAFLFGTAAGNIGSNLASIQSNLPRTPGDPIVGPVAGQLTRTLKALVFATKSGLVYAYNLDGFALLRGFPVTTGAAISQPPAIADVDGDGNRDIIVFSGSRIFAINIAGSMLDYFPQTIGTGGSITSAPVVADVNMDGNTDIIAVTTGGYVAAYDKSGRMIPGFPLQAGTGVQTVAAFTSPLPFNSTGVYLAVASSEAGTVSAWKTGESSFGVPAMPWPQNGRDAQHSGLINDMPAGSPLSSQFFPADRAYNWPNPVYNGSTFIRYFVRENAAVSIRIYDLAGDLVTSIPNPPGVGGVDNEIEWKTGDVQNGVYFARIEANGTGGSGVAVVKIAVVK